MPPNALPPKGLEASGEGPLPPVECCNDHRRSRRTQETEKASRAADKSSRFSKPIGTTRTLVITGPTNAPVLPPAEMIPNSRRLCSVDQMSAMKLQNTDTTNRLKTLNQTKNDRAAHTLASSSSMNQVKSTKNSRTFAIKK